MNLDVVSIRLIPEKTLRNVFSQIISVENAAQIFQELIGGIDREVMALLTLDTAKQPINVSIVSIGTLNNTMVHPREIFKTAILSNANSIILAHNHPSGSVAPSFEDEQVTRRIEEAGKLLGIELMDHLIIGDDTYYSFFKESFGPLFGVSNIEQLSVTEPQIEDIQKHISNIIAKKKEEKQTLKNDSVVLKKQSYIDSR